MWKRKRIIVCGGYRNDDEGNYLDSISSQYKNNKRNKLLFSFFWLILEALVCASFIVPTIPILTK